MQKVSSLFPNLLDFLSKNISHSRQNAREKQQQKGWYQFFHFHSSPIFPCDLKESSQILFSCFDFCQVERVSSTNLLCYSVGVSHRWSILSLRSAHFLCILLSLTLLAFIFNLSSRVFLKFSVPRPRIGLNPTRQKCSVRCLQYAPYE